MSVIALLKNSLYIVEMIALVSAVYQFNTVRIFHHKALVYYFLFIVLAESLGRIMVAQKLLEYTQYWYGFIVIPIEFFFFFWFLLQHFTEKKDKLFVKTGMFVLAVSFIVEWTFFDGTQTIFISLSYTLGNLILLLFVILYFKNLIHSKRILSFTSEPEFWICSGLLLFYLGTFPLFGLYTYFLDNYPVEFRIYYTVMLGLDNLMYLIFAIGMIWTKPR